MFQSDVDRDYRNEDAAVGLRYALGCAMELTLAVWLLMPGGNFRPFSTWLAYYLFVQTGVVVLFGFWWYGFWAYERHATPWYLAGVASLIGATCLALEWLFALGLQGWDVALSPSLCFSPQDTAHGVLSGTSSFVVSIFCCWPSRKSEPRGVVSCDVEPRGLGQAWRKTFFVKHGRTLILRN